MIRLILPLFLLTGCNWRSWIHADPPPPPTPPSDVNMLMLWIIAGSIVGMGVGIAALVWLPTKKLAMSIIAGFGGILGIALTVKAIQPYMGFVLLALGLFVAGAGIYLFRKYVLVGKQAIQFGVAVAQAPDERIEAIKQAAMVDQIRAGTHDIISTEIAKLKGT